MSNRGTPYYLLDRRAGWRAAALDGVVEGEAAACLRLRSLPGAARPLVDAGGSFGGLALPTGLAVDGQDRVYILDGHTIKRFDPCSASFATLPCIGGPGDRPRQLRNPRGLAIGCGDNLYIADTDNRRVQVFALKGLPLRAIWGPWRVVDDADGLRVAPAAPERPAPGPADCVAAPLFPADTWQPWDVAISAAGRAYVADYANGLIHVVDPQGAWRGAYDGAGPGIPPLARPTAIALDRSGRLYVVQEGRDYVTVLDGSGAFLEQVARPDQVKGRFCPLAIAVDGEGNLLISDRATRAIYVYCRDADGCLTCAGVCQTFDWSGAALAFDRSGQPLLGVAERGLVARLEPRAAYATEGRYYSAPLDSRAYRCQWHRVVVRAYIPAGAHIRVDTLTAESPKTIDEVRTLPEERWAGGQIHAQVGDGEWDCLVHSPPGRYLWLRLTLVGAGATTPAVESIQVFYPRASSLRYLPAVYSEDLESRDFLDRFLSIFDTIWGGIGDRIGAIAGYFDPAAAPAGASGAGGDDFLTWLAAWIGLTLDRHWPESRRRRLLQEAHRLYALRGTPEGLRLHIELYTGLKPQILEHFKLRRWLFLGHGRLDNAAALWGAEIVKRLQLDEHSRIGSFQLVDSGDPLRDPFYYYAHQFTIYVPLRGPASETQRHALEQIVELARPAHAQGYLRLVEPRMRVGVQACIGVDTVIGQYPNQVMTGTGRLGYDTLLGPTADEAGPPTMRIGVRTRIGSSTLID